MLRNNFRTKLLGILAVPVAALIAITAFAGYGRLSEARDAGKLRHRIDVIAAGTALAHQVQLEQASSADLVANPGADHSDLNAQRRATDQAVQAYRDAVRNAGDVSSTAFDAGIDRVGRNLNALITSYRGAVDLGSDINSVTSAYSEIGASISDLIGTVADESTDPGLAREASALAALSHAKDSTAKEWAVLEVSLDRGAFKDAEEGTFRGAVAERDRWLGIHNGLASATSRSSMQVRMSGPAITVSDSIERNALATTGTEPLVANPFTNQPATPVVKQWHDAMRARLDVLSEVLSQDTTNLAGHASTIEHRASQDLRTFLLAAAAAVLASTGLGLVLARTVTMPLRELKNAAEQLADEQLPALVNGLRHPGQEDERWLATTLTPIEVRSGDEIGQLARAFNTVQTVAVDVAAEQATLLRKGISEIFVNLARRNQVLIDRQIEFLDELEATEDDPDQLAQLYRLDHLATRMRRNAESLLVLAGIEPARTRTRPVPLFDVVRAAIGEVEDFSRIDLTTFDDVDVIGNAAVDLGHLLAELMDNAAHFSPPDTRVRVEGRHGRAGYVISVVDSGIGMTDEQLAEANELLSSPPPVGLALSRSLGFTVVARLAARYGASVRLLRSDAIGTTAIVHLPQHVIATGEADEAWAPGAAEIAEAVEAPVPPVEDASVATATADPWAPAVTAPADDAAALEPVALGDEGASAPETEPVPLVDWSDDACESVVRAAWGEDEPLAAEDVTPRLDEEFAPYGDEVAPYDDEVAPYEVHLEPYEQHAAAEYTPHEDDVEDDGARSIAAWVDDGAGEDAYESDDVMPDAPPVADGPPATLREAVPEGPSFDQGLAALVDGPAEVGVPDLIEPPVPELPAVDDSDPVVEDDASAWAHLARSAEPEPEADVESDVEPTAEVTAPHTGEPVGEPQVAGTDGAAAAVHEPSHNGANGDVHDGDHADSETTAAGLVRRVRNNNTHGLEGLDRYHAAPSGPSILATKRSPDDVKAMLARYRTGLHRGRAGDEPIEPESGSE